MTTEARSEARSWMAVVFVLAPAVGIGLLCWNSFIGPTVPDAVVRSVRGEGIRIVDVEEAYNTGSGDWTNTYLLIEVDGADPVARLESALTANGWTVNVTEGMLPSAYRAEAGLALLEFAVFQRDSGRAVPQVLRAFEREAVGQGHLFVAVLMPY